MKCFFFDRDGVLIKNYGYLIDKSKIKWLKGAIQSIKILNKRNIKVVIVTNQSGVARGFFTENELKEFHNFMNEMLLKYNAKIDIFYYCPYHPKGKIKKYSKKSNLRKPDNGMLLNAIKKFKLDPSECFMIGDKETDYLSAKKTKIPFQFKKNYSLEKQVNNILSKLDDF
ncbi:D-glycero-alpha-D-manno-heptose-1,7-bisphosphate 7-phosphatase [Candidatus Pelagibacter bacterium nBUS_30]|uniref:D-glycero-alpha-D-manno-heptose-1,7-bisphosphate 7-phosphatase n=1 Tax=Candidatus Pelagibacter bacterium nBUS_30 TaxID=3374191 RepID=UPI003EBF6F42